ncbi:PREDICTED: serine-threonine kinase receptor-associated protein [Drosophila arizonae]|uniref:Serine-threonine kinase receptor-associated protein n=1 Tax=Drosophila arizonae TaxID=7263 RepID=A0ABM1PM96_DROAR|nr:PREDICTED: serine-threonine kinase receptor-associated protein [Drosophila arizonae]
MAKRFSNIQLPVSCVGHTSDVFQLAFSKVCESGYYLASACQDGQVMLRHGDTGDWVGTFEQGGEPILSVDINADATLLASGGDDCAARIWDAVDGKQLTKMMVNSTVRCVALSSKSEYLAVGCLDRKTGHRTDKVLYMYALEHPESPMSFEGQARGVRDVIFCRDDRAMLSSSHDRSIRLWDRISGKQVHSISLPHHAKSVELCADGRTVSIAYGHSTVFVDVDRFEVLQHHKLPVRLIGVSLHPERKTYVCAGSNRWIYKCDYATGEILETFNAHERHMHCIKYSPDGEVYASSAADGGLRLWQQTVGKKYALWDARILPIEEEDDEQGDADDDDTGGDDYDDAEDEGNYGEEANDDGNGNDEYEDEDEYEDDDDGNDDGDGDDRRVGVVSDGHYDEEYDDGGCDEDFDGEGNDANNGGDCDDEEEYGDEEGEYEEYDEEDEYEYEGDDDDDDDGSDDAEAQSYSCA